MTSSLLIIKTSYNDKNVFPTLPFIFSTIYLEIIEKRQTIFLEKRLPTRGEKNKWLGRIFENHDWCGGFTVETVNHKKKCQSKKPVCSGEVTKEDLILINLAAVIL